MSVPVRGDARSDARPSSTSSRTWKPGGRWTGSSSATSGMARPRSRSGPHSRRSRRGSRSRCSAPPRSSPSSIIRPSPSDSRATRSSRGPLPLPHPQTAEGVVAGLATGEVDVVIGTHRLLSEDIHFKDLGLLVVDEEQRFGVSAKDAIKRLKVGVDVLTLTATPIPRTLEMALTGIRDVTHIRTPPEDRHPILTYVGPYDEQSVSAAIRRETSARGSGLLRPQQGAVDRSRRRSPPGTRARRRDMSSLTVRCPKASSSR